MAGITEKAMGGYFAFANRPEVKNGALTGQVPRARFLPAETGLTRS